MLRVIPRSAQVITVAAAALVLLLPAVVARSWLFDRQESTTVSVKAVPLDLAYGASPPPDAGVEEIVRTLVPGLADGFEFPEIDLSFGPRTPIGSNDPCPAPGPDVFPEEPAGLDVGEPIRAGIYPFQQEGTFEVVGVAKVPLLGFTTRTVRDVQTGEEGSFTFELSYAMALRRVSLGLEVVPGDGMFLTRLQTTTARPGSGEEEERIFEPLVPVEILPLPIGVGAPFSSVGIDPGTLEVFTLEGRVTEKPRIEGCNEVVDGWKVEATWSLQRPGGQAILWDFDYTVAPQHGGMIVADRIKTTEQIGPLTFVIDVSSRFGSLTPKPEGGG